MYNKKSAFEMLKGEKKYSKKIYNFKIIFAIPFSKVYIFGYTFLKGIYIYLAPPFLKVYIYIFGYTFLKGIYIWLYLSQRYIWLHLSQRYIWLHLS